MRTQSTIERIRALLGGGRAWGTLGKAAVLVGIGFLAAWLILPTGQRSERGDEGRHAAEHDQHAGQMWTCSMHPQIQRPGPGSCPICGMDLIPVGRSGAALTSLRQLELSPAARELMNIQVRPVERRFVTAEVRMVGKVEYDETRLKRITAWIPGRLDRLYVDYTGVAVRKGDHMVFIYSPELYSAQQELIQALRSARERGQEPPRSIISGIDLVESSREKLRLLGLTDEQLREIESQDRPESHLTLYAPIGGIVVEKLEEGRGLRPNGRTDLHVGRSQPGLGAIGRLRIGFCLAALRPRGDLHDGSLSRARSSLGRVSFIDPSWTIVRERRKSASTCPTWRGSSSRACLSAASSARQVAAAGRRRRRPGWQVDQSHASGDRQGRTGRVRHLRDAAGAGRIAGLRLQRGSAHGAAAGDSRLGGPVDGDEGHRVRRGARDRTANL
jgi:hypothetical protein